MMAPDYTWWHGFYECKKRTMDFMDRANRLIEIGKSAPRVEPFPGATGSTTKPSEVFGEEP